jgi:hypothetical protein
MNYKHTPSEVFEAIAGERAYQDAMQGNAARDTVETNRELGSLILFLDTYVGKAKAAFSGPHPEGRAAALREIRKVAALACLAMEVHGVYKR